jgi:TP901 family phage tail tape measure protein
MASLSDLIVKLGVDASGFQKGIESATAKLSSFGGKAKEIGSSLTTGVSLPLAGIGAGVLAMAGNFEASMQKVKAVSGATGADFDALRNQAKDLGATTQFSASQAADGMAFLSQAGFTATQTLSAMPAMLDLAAAGQLDLAAAADIASNVMGAFGLQAEEAGRAADVMAAAAAASNTNIEQMGQAMKFAAPVAKATGVSMEQTAAMIGVLGNSGIQATMAGTSLRSMLGRLEGPTKDVRKAMGELGVSITDNTGKVRPLTDVLKDLSAAGAGAGDMKRIFGQEAASAALILADGMPQYDKLVDKFQNSEGAAAEMAKTMNEGLNGAMKGLMSATEGLALAIADSGLLEWATSFVAKATEIVRGLATTNPELLRMGTIVAAVAAAIGPVLLVVGTLAAKIAAVVPAVTGAATAISGAGATVAAFATGPVGLTIAAVAALAAGAVFLMDKFGVLAPVIDAAKSGLASLGAGFMMVWDNLGTLVSGFGVWIHELTVSGTAFGEWIEWGRAASDFISQKMAPVFEFLGNVIRTVVTVHIEAAAWAFGFLKDKAKEVFDFFLAKGKSVETVGEAAKQTAAETQNLGKALDSTAGAAKAIGTESDALVKRVVKLGNDTKDTKDKVFDLDKALRDIEAAASKYSQGLKAAEKAGEELWKKISKDLRPEIESLGEDLSLMADGAADAFAAVGSALDQKLTPSLDRAKFETAQTAEAFKALGIKTTTELNDLAAKAEEQFARVKASGEAAPAAIDAAWIKMTQARKAALIANGSDLTAEEQKMLDKLLEQQKGHKDKSLAIWDDWAKTIQDAVMRLDIGGKIFAGKFSAGEWRSTLSGMAEDLKNKFANPAITAINNLIDKGVNMLMGALDRLIGKLIGQGGLQAAWSGVFGGGASAGGAAAGGAIPGIPGMGGGGGGSGSGGGGAGGTMGIINMATGIATTVSSIIGNFQTRTTNDRLLLIEQETRQTKELIRDQVLPDLWFKSNEMQFGVHVKATEAARDALFEIRNLLRDGITVAAASAIMIGNSAGAAVAEAGPPPDAHEQIVEAIAAGPSASRTGQVAAQHAREIATALAPSMSRTSQILAASVAPLPPMLSRTNAVLEDVATAVNVFSAPMRSRTGQIEGPEGPSAPMRSRTGQIERPEETFTGPLRSRTGQIQSSGRPEMPETITFGSLSVSERQRLINMASQQGLLANIFGPGVQASAGAGLSHSADISSFLEEIGFFDPPPQLDAISDSSAQIAELLSNPVTVESPSLQQILERLSEQMERPIIITLDGEEIARVVGSHQEAMRATA